MTPETRQKIMYEEHEQKWAPVVHHPRGRVMRQPKRLAAAIINRPAEQPDVRVDAAAFRDNPGPGARWCPDCKDWVADGMGVVRRTGVASSAAIYTVHCPKCEGRLSR